VVAPQVTPSVSRLHVSVCVEATPLQVPLLQVGVVTVRLRDADSSHEFE
jgi:hypothetical protein